MQIMRSNKRQKAKHRNNGSNGQIVRVSFSHPEATAVGIAGTFNDWRPEATPMIAMGQGHWLKELVLPPGTYEYLIVADGKWLADPQAKRTAANPFGGVNSVITVPDNQNSDPATAGGNNEN